MIDLTVAMPLFVIRYCPLTITGWIGVWAAWISYVPPHDGSTAMDFRVWVLWGSSEEILNVFCFGFQVHLTWARTERALTTTWLQRTTSSGLIGKTSHRQSLSNEPHNLFQGDKARKYHCYPKTLWSKTLWSPSFWTYVGRGTKKNVIVIRCMWLQSFKFFMYTFLVEFTFIFSFSLLI